MKHWQILAHVSELSQPNDYVCLPWKADGELAIMRNADGTLTAFDNRCPHRGARIFTNLRGNRPPVCGYHGRHAKPSEVNAFAHSVVDGWILVCDAKIDEITSVSVPWLEDLRRFASTPKTQYHSTIGPYEYACHWTVAVENALDHEHIRTVHAETLEPLGLVSQTVREYPDGSSFERFEAHARDKIERLCELFRAPSGVDYFHLHVFPHTALSSTRGTSYSLQHYFPRTDGKTCFVSRLYGTPAVNLAAGEQFLDGVGKFNAKVFREDATICALVAPGHMGKLQPNEARIAHFREFARA